MARILKPTKRTTPDEWGRANRVYPPTSGVPGPRDPSLTPYTIPFARAFAGLGTVRRVVLVTGAQSGKTDTFLDVVGWRADERPAPTLYVGPNKEFLTDQFEPRLMALFDEAKVLRQKIERGKRMKKTLKRVAGVPIRLAHAGSSTALKSDPAALAIVDEYDEMLKNIKGQGDPLGLVEARGYTFADFITGIASTPGQGTVETEVDEATGLEYWKVADPEDIQSPIWKLWQEGTRHHWVWVCPECQDPFIPRLKQLWWPGRGEKDECTPAEAKKKAMLECPRCHCLIGDDRKLEMNASGFFVAPGQELAKIDGSWQVLGAPPENSTTSYWVSGLASPFVSFGERASNFLKAKASGEADKIQTATNANFGELYSLAGGDVPAWTEVAALRMPYPERSLPDGAHVITAGLDVQKSKIVFVVRGWGARATSWLIEHGEVWGDTTEVETWKDVTDLVTTTWGGLPIKIGFMDSGFRPGRKDILPINRVYDFCRKHQRFIFPTKGVDTLASPVIKSRIEVDHHGKGNKYGLELYRLDTDYWKRWVHERVRWDPSEPGAWHLHEATTEDYCRQIVSEGRTTAPGTGKPIWTRLTPHNHYLDCEAMAAAAGYILNVHRIREARRESVSLHPESSAVAKSEVANRFGDFASMLNG